MVLQLAVRDIGQLTDLLGRERSAGWDVHHPSGGFPESGLGGALGLRLYTCPKTATLGGHMLKVGIIGAGLVGLATARQLTASGVPVVIWEKEAAVAQHQSGHNSGVAHAGIYYQPGSAKARNCRRGVELLRAYCADRGLPWDERGKLVVARDELETQRLREIERRSQANGVPGVRWLDGPDIRALEPDVAGVAALLSPTTAIVDFPAIARASPPT